MIRNNEKLPFRLELSVVSKVKVFDLTKLLIIKTTKNVNILAVIF